MADVSGISVNLAGAEHAVLQLETLGRSGALALRQTINTTARRGNTLLVRTVTRSLNLRPSYVRERIRLRLATGAELRAQIIVKKRDILLSRYGATQQYRRRQGKKRRAGIAVKVKKGGAKKLMPGAFFVTLKNSGARAVAIRDPRGGKYATGKARFEVLYGPSVFQHVGLKLKEKPGIMTELAGIFVAEARRQYQRRLPH